MNYYPFVIKSKKLEVEDTYIFRFVPLRGEKIPSFLPGQYCFIANPTYKNPEEFHPFSIASSPLQENYLEFCIKTYGLWTQAFVKKKTGETIYISESQGKFIWHSKISHAVFLLGGIGISPIMSILRYITENKQRPSSITVLYGNRTLQTIAYKNELENLQAKIPHFNIVHIFSHLPPQHSWKGYTGFITEDIIKKEINLSKEPAFFLVGPPIFLKKMQDILINLHIPDTNIIRESLDIQIVSPTNR